MLYGNRNLKEAEGFIARLVPLLRLAEGSRVLDIPCGRGRHSLALHKLGLRVTGADLSPKSIAHAKQFEGEGLEFYVHDMRKPFRVNYYDAVLNLFTSMGYFENVKDELAVVRSAAAAIKPQGLLVIDFMNVKVVCERLVKEEEKEVQGHRYTIRRSLEGGFLKKEISCGGKVFTERVRALEQDDFEAMFRACGLKTIHLCGDYELNAFEPQRSPRLILIAQKT